jgi:SPX domain protein involved in polyphosphate accumulation
VKRKCEAHLTHFSPILLTCHYYGRADPESREVSLTVPPQTDATGNVIAQKDFTEEMFFKQLDSEIAKVEAFTLKQVQALREKLAKTEQLVTTATSEAEQTNVRLLTDAIGEDFLRLEKYVNINFMGFHKILKKHDRFLPNNPCKFFYVSRMHDQAWVRGDYSDLVVRMSTIYSQLRGDKTAQDKEQASFLRSTSKYWVKTEDVSRVKYAILKHLPVFLQKSSTGEADSQLTNSVYLDNDQMELYQGRLDKTAGAIALRFRWYGTNEPTLVFVERKTHRDHWTGEMSAKERFLVRYVLNCLVTS